MKVSHLLLLWCFPLKFVKLNQTRLILVQWTVSFEQGNRNQVTPLQVQEHFGSAY